MVVREAIPVVGPLTKDEYLGAMLIHVRAFGRSACAAIGALILFGANAQYNGPESVEYDPVGDRYFVSNTSNSRIKVRDQSGTVSDWATGIPNAPYGLEIMGNILYACAGNGVRGYDLATGAEVYYRNLGASFPNGITSDGEFLYITDFNTSARRIYKVDPVNDTHSTLVANTGAQPNGIVWDPTAERLVTVFWGSNAPIKAYDRDTGAETILVANTGVGSIDGVTIDCDGNFLIASWSPARITRYESSFVQAGVNLDVPGLNNPADIDFDHTNQRVCIPNAGNNTVTLFDVTCITSGSSELDSGAPIQAMPNPATDRLRLDPPLVKPEHYQIFDPRGQLVGGGILQQGADLDVSTLPPGVYLIHLSNLGSMLRFVKE